MTGDMKAKMTRLSQVSKTMKVSMLRGISRNKPLVLWIITVLCLTTMFHFMRQTTPIVNFKLNTTVKEIKTFKTVPSIDNYVDFPCLPGVAPTEALKKRGKCVRTLTRLNFDKPATLMEGCTYLKYGQKSLPICTYSPAEDILSDYIWRHGNWEKPFVDIMLRELAAMPNMILFDVGTNIGVYCISAVADNKPAICLDANQNNLRKVARSVFLAKMTGITSLIWNALSDNQSTIQFHVAKGNNGMSRIADLNRWNTETEENLTVDTITLNDLQDYDWFINRPVFMKISVEGHEVHILRASSEFFQKVNVRIVQIGLSERDTKMEVIDLFEKFGFLPFAEPRARNGLRKEDALTNKWPGELFFVRK